MIINQATIDDLFTNFKTTFTKALEAAPTQWSQTAMLVPSTGAKNVYSFMDLFPKAREWVGDKHLKNLSAYSYTLTNQEYESTIQVRRSDLENDQVGIYRPAVESSGYAAKQMIDELMSALKDGAFSSLCYDGQAFYSASHPLVSSTGVSSTFSNAGTAALSAATLAACTASYGAGRSAIMGMTDYEGRKLGLMPDTLEVPPALEAVARIICESPTLIDQGPNPYRGTARVLVNPRLSSSTAWFLHVTSMPIRPFIYQERKAPEFVSKTSPESDMVFMRGEYLFGFEAACAVGFGLPQMSYGSTGGA